jgi:hypothetical protein
LACPPPPPCTLRFQNRLQGFPTIKLFSPGAKGPSVRDYQGERSAKALAEAALGAARSPSVAAPLPLAAACRVDASLAAARPQRGQPLL